MTKNLVIVESPAKAKTIKRYLGSDYEVKSSYGHIRDLPKKGMSIDIEHGFTPTYDIPADKKKTVADLKKSVKTATTVWLATDEDREGEAIAWHLAQALGLKAADTKRITFHEITKTAILESVKNPRTVDQHLVDAQQARRVLDRLVGYELSPVLWKKIRTGLSAGRVQSVAVRLIVERERDIEKFEATISFKVQAEFTLKSGEVLPATLAENLPSEEAAQKFLESIKAATFTIAGVAQKPGTRNPGAPFTTSTLQQEASRRLSYSVRRTMTLAQRLYEAGHITYMRTDSTTLSNQALAQAAQLVTEKYGKEYSQTRQFATKNKSAQEAHEAIRPSDFAQSEAGEDDAQKKLYRLIWQRALASQMAPAKVEKTTITIDATGTTKQFQATGEVIVFDGFLKVTPPSKRESVLPEVNTGDKLDLIQATATETYSKPPARFTEASLVKQLEEMGIGRPSTYAPTISTIQDRGYVERADLEPSLRNVVILSLSKGKVSREITEEQTGADKNKLLPTDIGNVVTDFLVKHFKHVVDYDFTADVENKFDHIANGKQKWQAMIEDFYGKFHKTIEAAESVTRQDAAQRREIGKHPKTGEPIFARYGRYGPMIQMGEGDDETKPKFAPIPKGESMDSITLEDALELLSLPRIVGKTADGDEILANIGPYGPYVRAGKLTVSMKDESPFSISEATARALIRSKAKQEADKYIQRFEKEKIDVINGPYGPYITNGKKNAKIPKETDPKKLTLKECQKLLAAAPDKKGKRRHTVRK